jgi:hypothetical protein
MAIIVKERTWSDIDGVWSDWVDVTSAPVDGQYVDTGTTQYRLEEEVDINIEDVVNGSVVGQEWKGTGTFDILVNAVNKNIELQYTQGRITGSDYAAVYLGAIQQSLSEGIAYSLQRPTVEAQLRMAEEETKMAYVNRVGKDKQVAMMEIDNALGVAKANKLNDEAWVYEPMYEENN